MNVNSNLPWTFRRIAARLEGVAGWDVFTGIGSYIAKNDAEWLIVPNTDPRAAAQAADEDGEPIDAAPLAVILNAAMAPQANVITCAFARGI